MKLVWENLLTASAMGADIRMEREALLGGTEWRGSVTHVNSRPKISFESRLNRNEFNGKEDPRLLTNSTPGHRLEEREGLSSIREGFLQSPGPSIYL